MKKLLPLALAVALAFYLSRPPAVEVAYQSGEPGTPAAATAYTDAVAAAYANQASGIQVSGEGAVSRILDDDDDGSRHQRFILRLASGQTLLVAHNVDLAPRIESLRVGDRVEFSGEYQWNDMGGVLHWTHRDPQGKHEAGWLKHRGRTYQ